jgi:hypothetical protein
MHVKNPHQNSKEMLILHYPHHVKWAQGIKKIVKETKASMGNMFFVISLNRKIIHHKLKLIR